MKKENSYKGLSTSEVRSNLHLKQTDILLHLFDMAYVASVADNSFVLPPPIRSEHSEAAIKKYEEDVAFTQANFQRNLEIGKKINNRHSVNSQMFKAIRRVYPDFCQKMDSKIPEQDYELYHSYRLRLKNVLFKHDTYAIKGPSSKEVLLEYQDSLANIIDTPDFSKACKIEDEFVLSELEIFFDKFSELTPAQRKEILSTKIESNTGEKFDVISLAQKAQKERRRRIQKFDEIDKLYKKIEAASCIKLKLDSPKDDER